MKGLRRPSRGEGDYLGQEGRMPLEKRVGNRSMSVGGEPGSAWGSNKGDQFTLSEQDLADLRKLQQLQMSQAQLLAAGSEGFKSWGSDKEAGKMGIQGSEAPLMKRREGGLPPRAPPSGNEKFVGGQGVGGGPSGLPSMPSMVDRMSDSSKDYVDPKDAQNLLPSSLLDSASLDLAGYMESFDPSKGGAGVGGLGAGVNIANLNLLDPQAFDISALQGGLPRRHRVGGRGQGPTFQDTASVAMPTSVPQSIPLDTNVLPLRRRQIHHQRSNSEPVLPGFMLPTFPGNQGQVSQGAGTGTAGAGVRTLPVLAVLPDFSVLPADLIDGQGIAARGPPIRNVLPVRTKDRTMSFDHNALLQGIGGFQDRAGHNRSASRGDLRTDARGPNSRRSRNKSHRSMSVDMGRPQQQNKGSFPPKAERKVSAPKNAKSAPSKGEVKRLVDYQVLLARPIRTPWFRETPRSPKSGDEEEQEGIEEHLDQVEEVPAIQTKPQAANSPVSSPVSKMKVQVEDPISQEAPSTPSPSPKRPNTGVKGTGFFCPSMP